MRRQVKEAQVSKIYPNLNLGRLDPRCNIEQYADNVNVLTKSYSKEGMDIILKFAAGTRGSNRAGIMQKLVDLQEGKIAELSKAVLRSYANTALFELVTTGDLIEFKVGNAKMVKSAKTLGMRARIYQVHTGTMSKVFRLDKIYASREELDAAIASNRSINLSKKHNDKLQFAIMEEHENGNWYIVDTFYTFKT